MERIGHYIGGKHVPGESGRRGPVYDPATGEQTHEVDFADAAELNQAGRGCQGGAPGLARDVAVEAGRDHVPDPRAARGPQDRRRDRPHVAARQGALGRDGRGAARARERRVRDGDPAPAEGRLLRAGVHRRRRVRDPSAARGGRGHHAVQLPRDGPDLDVRERDGLRQHLHPQALREGPRRGARARRAVRGRRAARRRVQRRPGRQGGGGRDPRASRHPGGELRGLDADRALHLHERHGQREARAGARRREEPHDRAARRRRRHGGRRGGLGRATARPASAAWRSRS